MDLTSTNGKKPKLDKEGNHLSRNSLNKHIGFQSPEYSLCILHTFEMIQTSHNQMLIHGPSIGSAIRSFCSSSVFITCHTSLFKFVVLRTTMGPRMARCTKRVHHSVLTNLNTKCLYLQLPFSHKTHPTTTTNNDDITCRQDGVADAPALSWYRMEQASVQGTAASSFCQLDVVS
jgi:hypothetical protein